MSDRLNNYVSSLRRHTLNALHRQRYADGGAAAAPAPAAPAFDPENDRIPGDMLHPAQVAQISMILHENDNA